MENIETKLLQKYSQEKLTISEVLSILFENEDLKIKYLSPIRRFTVIGNIANKILENNGGADRCKVMAIGDIKYPTEIMTQWKNILKNALDKIDIDNLVGYDLTGIGSSNLHLKIYDYMNYYYNFPKELNNEIINSIIPCYGSTDGFSMLVDSLVQKNKNIELYYPEASFMPNIKIAETLGIKTFGINKPSNNDFFITKSQIDEIYKTKLSSKKIYYFTAIGNPTGEKIGENNLYKIAKYITEIDKNAIILLDNVYVGLLKQNESVDLFKDYFQNKGLLSQTIFVESLSKTLGTTGIRLAWMWTLNRELNSFLKSNITLKKAGFSKLLDECCIKLLSDLERINNFSILAYNHFSRKRLEFLEYVKENYFHYFDFESSPKILDREGIYILLKVKGNYITEEIFAKTSIIGVEIVLSDGKYIRYSFGID